MEPTIHRENEKVLSPINLAKASCLSYIDWSRMHYHKKPTLQLAQIDKKENSKKDNA